MELLKGKILSLLMVTEEPGLEGQGRVSAGPSRFPFSEGCVFLKKHENWVLFASVLKYFCVYLV